MSLNNNPLRQPRWITAVYKGETITDTLSGWARRIGLTPMGFSQRVNRLGEQEAVDAPVLTASERSRIAGSKTKGLNRISFRIRGRNWSMREIAEHTGLSISGVEARARSGLRGEALLAPNSQLRYHRNRTMK